MKIKEVLLTDKSKLGVGLYGRMLKSLDHSRRKKYNNPVKLVLGASIKPGDIILEIGCGSGFFTEEISKHVGSEGKVYATDIHPVAIKVTENKVRELQLDNVIVEQQDAMNTTYENNFFDKIILYGVIPAPVIPLSILSKEIERILKPDGVCAIWTAVPGWRPKQLLKNGNFQQLERQHKIFRIQKVTVGNS